ncbi:MAG: amino acid carrier protein [Lachnospiraceae bacterium]|nr:amino acid carrier protein [Lachnospiraceae bacterium]
MTILTTISDLVLAFTNWVWGIPMLIWLVGGGIFLSFRMHFIQFTKLGFILKNIIVKAFRNTGDGGKGRISGFKAVTGALASTLGAGNIVGTALAIGYGGPGGVFWLWLTGLFASMVKYCKVVLGMKYRRRKDGQWFGGPQYYLTDATGWKWMGLSYAFFGTITLFIAASAQVGSVVDTVEVMNVPRLPATIVIIILAALIVIGGMTRLLDFTERIVPAMSVIYIIGGLAVILLNIQALPAAFISIFRYAFTGRAAVGGFAGATVASCIRWGVARGIYSNDAGTGVTTITHAAADVNHPVQQGMWGVFEVFFDTIVVCSITCFAILTTGVWTTDASTSVYTITAFQQTLGNALGGGIVSVALALFCFTTAVAQILFGCDQLAKLFDEKARIPGRYAFLAFLLVGGIVGIEGMINYLDFFVCIYIAINMIGVYLCNGQIKELTEEYFADPKRWETERWQPYVEMEKEDAKNAKEA